MIGRWMLRVYSFIIAFISLWATFWLLGYGPVQEVTRFLIANNVMFLVVAVMFLWSLRYLLFPMQKREIHSFVKTTESGDIRIGFAAVNELARRAASQLKGVARLHSHVQERPEGLVVWIKVRADAGVDLTALSEQMQQAVSEAIRSATSLTVQAVHVQIAELAPATLQKS
ncbi:MAG: alkaline shock response membrane anchor protein AmaP [Firmicutes bacterium]|nr:alkaline shock response membrane anchor protein AmaP [Bacillota bacterium]